MVNPGNEDSARRYVGDQVTIVHTLLTKWWIKGPTPPRIDARDLMNEYQTYEWGTDVPLEKICLEELGSMAKRSDGAPVQKGRIVVAMWAVGPETMGHDLLPIVSLS